MDIALVSGSLMGQRRIYMIRSQPTSRQVGGRNESQDPGVRLSPADSDSTAIPALNVAAYGHSTSSAKAASFGLDRSTWLEPYGTE